MRKFLLLLIILALFVLKTINVSADELDDVTKQLDSLKSSLKTKEGDQQKLINQLQGIRSRVDIVEIDLKKKEVEVERGEKALTLQREILNKRVFVYYKNINKSSVSLLDFLVSEKLSSSLQSFFYQQTLVDEDKRAIIKIVRYVVDLEEKKKNLQSEKSRLLVIKNEVDKQSQVLGADISSTRSKIAQLSSQQQSLIAAKLSSLNIPRSAGTSARGCSDDRGVDPGFSPRLAFFTFGAPHRVGLNQYGAKGRAEGGQNYEAILRAYFNFDEIKTVDINTKIKVDGIEYPLEEYMKGIHEMPASWPPDALRAQAIAARSYAMAYTNNGSGSICATESCQVFSPPGDRSDGWTQAVKDTEGKVAAQGGNAIKAWFASTHGGYVFSSAEVWGGGTSFTKHATDTTTGSAGGFEDLQNNAYDKSSPWFYCDWGARGQGNTAWLRPTEVADIANIILLARADSSTTNHLYQPDKPNPTGTDTWDAERVKSELRARGGSPIDSTTDVSLGVDFGSGKVTSVSVAGRSFSGSEFKDWFNLRAPANIQIVGPLFNVERR